MDTPSPEQVLAEARAATGLSDFGDPAFHAGLERNLEALGRLPLLPDARTGAFKDLTGDLCTRLRVEAWRKANPECDRQVVEGPVLVCGLPRTGTTATVAMLALDRRFRFLRGWEGRAPTPAPVLGEEDRDPRAIVAREAAKALDASIHLSDPDGPEEDLAMMAGLNMRHMHGRYPMPDDYMDWWIEDDFASTYAYHRRVLEVLQSRRPPNLWLLKAPPHLFKLEAFAREYPNARFVMTHRDPVKIIGSVASLYHHLYEGTCQPGAVDKAWTGRRCLDFWQEGVRRGLAARARIGDHRFIDVYNRDVVRDPVGTFERLYDRLGLSIDAELRGRLEAYHRANEQGRFGEHVYASEDFGLSDAAIREAFKAYVERFDV